MSRLIDLTGRQFGKLNVIEKHGVNKHRKATWKCECNCGNYSVVVGQDLRRGKVRSCGHCFGEHNVVHGLLSSRIYGIWCGMKNRCYNKNVSSYCRYGDRGIEVCDE